MLPKGQITSHKMTPILSVTFSYESTGDTVKKLLLSSLLQKGIEIYPTTLSFLAHDALIVSYLNVN